eukprot:TRINITY_DN42106_c0_g1_i1.p2 TRINITY_DN42106_c0_g1~~TRINITY_DN42106_c0_g1_i1.p2  ORF type:complete len:135 (-),score=37.10 TRINITY_DN42106_c0_g1_i1:190-594(-)
MVGVHVSRRRTTSVPLFVRCSFFVYSISIGVDAFGHADVATESASMVEEEDDSSVLLESSVVIKKVAQREVGARTGGLSKAMCSDMSSSHGQGCGSAGNAGGGAAPQPVKGSSRLQVGRNVVNRVVLDLEEDDD